MLIPLTRFYRNLISDNNRATFGIKLDRKDVHRETAAFKCEVNRNVNESNRHPLRDLHSICNAMTPADLAMRDALYESVGHGSSPPAMASAATPLLNTPPERNLTTFELHGRKSSEPVGRPLCRPPTPFVSLHQFHQFQHSPALSTSPDLDYKRVRRKQSFADLVRLPFAPASLPTQGTSFLPSQNSLPSLLPPLSSIPVPRPSTTSPSLSSSVDTFQSTPTHTPIQHGGSSFGQWSNFERVELSEPIRTKRKFYQLKPAKRLPHYTALHEDGDAVWEVHAAVVDLGQFDFGELEDLGQGGEAYLTGEKGKQPEHTAPSPVDGQSSGPRGRTVRFEGFETGSSSGTDTSGISQPTRSAQEKDPTLTSSFSLSKFDFPPPPGHTWTGTFGNAKK